jgi:hypothetical protein
MRHLISIVVGVVGGILIIRYSDPVHVEWTYVAMFTFLIWLLFTGRTHKKRGK